MQRTSIRHTGWFFGAVLVVVSTGLVACGVTSATPAANTTSVSTATTVAQSTGCPLANQTVSRAPASVLISPTGSLQQISLHVGQTLEVRLPFGRKWSYFPSSTDTLTLQSPAGYGDATVNSCIWRFTAAHTGSTSINFIFAPLCLPSMVKCSQLEGHAAFSVVVQ